MGNKDCKVEKSTPPSSNTEKIENKYLIESTVLKLGKNAKRLLARGNFAQVEYLCDQWIQIDNSNFEPYQLKGLAYKGLNECEKAIESIDKAISLKEGNPKLIFDKGTIHLHFKNYQESLEYFEKAISIHKSDHFMYFKCMPLIEMKMFDAALEAIEECLDSKPNNMRYINKKGEILLEIGRILEAQELFAQCLSRKEGNVIYLVNFGKSCLLLGDELSAYESFSKAKVLLCNPKVLREFNAHQYKLIYVTSILDAEYPSLKNKFDLNIDYDEVLANANKELAECKELQDELEGFFKEIEEEEKFNLSSKKDNTVDILDYTTQRTMNKPSEEEKENQNVEKLVENSRFTSFRIQNSDLEMSILYSFKLEKIPLKDFLAQLKNILDNITDDHILEVRSYYSEKNCFFIEVEYFQDSLATKIAQYENFEFYELLEIMDKILKVIKKLHYNKIHLATIEPKDIVFSNGTFKLNPYEFFPLQNLKGKLAYIEVSSYSAPEIGNNSDNIEKAEVFSLAFTLVCCKIKVSSEFLRPYIQDIDKIQSFLHSQGSNKKLVNYFLHLLHPDTEIRHSIEDCIYDFTEIDEEMKLILNFGISGIKENLYVHTPSSYLKEDYILPSYQLCETENEESHDSVSNNGMNFDVPNALSRINPNAMKLFNIGVKSFKVGKIEDSLELFIQAYENDIEFVAAMNNIAISAAISLNKVDPLNVQDQKNMIEEKFQKLLMHKKNHRRGTLNFAIYLAKENRFNECLTIIDRYLSNFSKCKFGLLVKAVCFMKMKNCEQGLNFLDKSINCDSSFEEGFFNKGVYYSQNNRIKESNLYYQQIKSKTLKSLALNNIGCNYIMENNHNDAMDSFKKSFNSDNNEKAMFNLSLMQNNVGSQKFEELYQTMPNDENILFLLTNKLMEHNPAKAIKHFQSNEFPLNLKMINNLCYAYFKNHEYDKASGILKDYIFSSEYTDESIEEKLLSNLAIYELKMGNIIEAEDIIEKALTLNPVDPLILTNKGIIQTYLRKYREALTSFYMSLNLDENQDNALKGKVYCLIALEKYEEGLKNIDEALRSDNKLKSHFLFQKANILSKLERFNEAVKLYEEVEKSRILEPDELLNIANSYSRNKLQAAKTYIERSLSFLSPKDISANQISPLEMEETIFLQQIAYFKENQITKAIYNKPVENSVFEKPYNKPMKEVISQSCNVNQFSSEYIPKNSPYKKKSDYKKNTNFKRSKTITGNNEEILTVQSEDNFLAEYDLSNPVASEEFVISSNLSLIRSRNLVDSRKYCVYFATFDKSEFAVNIDDEKLKMFKKLQSPFILKLISVFQWDAFIGIDQRYIAYVTEFFNETLEDKIHDSKELDERTAIKIMKDILNGLKAFHSVGIFMGNLSPSNIPFSNGNIKLSLFGNSPYNVFNLYEYESIKFPRIAPELDSILHGNKEMEVIRGNEKHDVFSLGVCILSLLFGIQDKAFEEEGKLNFSQLSIFMSKIRGEELRNLLEDMIKNDPFSRLSVSRIESVLEKILEDYTALDGYGLSGGIINLRSILKCEEHSEKIISVCNHQNCKKFFCSICLKKHPKTHYKFFRNIETYFDEIKANKSNITGDNTKMEEIKNIGNKIDKGSATLRDAFHFLVFPEYSSPNKGGIRHSANI